MSRHHPWFAIRKELSPRRRFFLSVFSFLLPIGLWCLVSYCPLIWHPMMRIADAGEVSFFKVDELVVKSFFLQQNEAMRTEGKAEATGSPANPVYLPAPAFGALAVAVLGINDAPKMAIIFIGTFFQQVLVVANTTEKLDESLLEAAQTLGARNIALLFTVVVPGILPNLYKDQRILLGWAWTYLIVAEVVGTSTGITWFINQQAKYRIYDNVFAAIMMIGIIGLATDLVLAALGRRLFAWDEEES